MGQLNKFYKEYFTLDGVTSKSFGVGISGSGAFKSAERDIETVHLAGRNGDLLHDNGGFLNRSMVYPCWMAGRFRQSFPAFRSFLMAHMDKYYTLRDTYYPGHFSLARVVGPIDPEPKVRLRAGEFDVAFECRPEYFMDDGNVFFSSGSVTNPTDFPCYPLIRISSSGTITLDGTTFEVMSFQGSYIEFDCETGNVYDENGSIVPYALHNDNFWKSNNRIKIEPGETMTFSGCQVKPRWYDM